MTVRISEYYDIYDVKVDTTLDSVALNHTEQLPKGIKDTHRTNPFRGFSNWSNFAANNPQNIIQIAGKVKAPQAITNIRIDENGDIWCYPPNVSVPYWNKIIFRNFDYYYNHTNTNKYEHFTELFCSTSNVSYPTYDLTEDAATPNDEDPLEIVQINTEFQEIPIFLKYDEYPSRSKVIFSSVDKTRNPDIEHRFGYHKGQMEPIKLNMSFTCNNPITDGTDHYNWNLTRDDINDILIKCYWSIEWIYEPEHGN